MISLNNRAIWWLKSVGRTMPLLEVFYLLTHLKINFCCAMNNRISLKYILVAYWAPTHIQIYTSER